MKRILLYLLLLTAVPVGAQNKDHNLDVAKNLDVMNAIYKYLDMMYVDTLDANEVIGNGIDAMLESLDPYIYRQICRYRFVDSLQPEIEIYSHR
jgi:carboxyl-terminal processing protease